MKSDQVKRLKALETESAQLRRAISDLTLDELIAASFGNTRAGASSAAWKAAHCSSFSVKTRLSAKACSALASALCTTKSVTGRCDAEAAAVIAFFASG